MAVYGTGTGSASRSPSLRSSSDRMFDEQWNRKRPASSATARGAIGGVSTASPLVNPSSPVKTGGSSGGSSGGSGGGGGTGSTGAGANPYASYLAQMADWYGAAIGNINSAYDQAAGAYASSLASARDQINASYNKSYNDVRRDAERALREAYINNMMNKRDLQQTLSAQGLNGGAAETTMASLANRYGSNRKEIDENWNNNISELALTRDNNLSQALQAYNSQMAQLAQARASQINNAEMARAQMTMQLGMANLEYLNKAGFPTLGYLGDLGVDANAYVTGLNGLVNNMADYNYNPSEVANPYTAASAQQGNAMTGTNYARYLASLEMMAEEQQKRNLGAALTPTGYANNGYQMTVR